MRDIRGIPAYDTYPQRVPAEVYNLWRRVWRRTRKPVAFQLEGIPPMAMEMEEALWVCVDVGLNGAPVIAWSDFADAGRALHDPVPCTVTQFHFGASKIRDQVLAVTAAELARRVGG